jgi:hypothetical protein
LFAALANEPGLADGSIVDAEDHLWNAQWGGRKIVRNAPNGAVEREFAGPVSNPTYLCLGGGDLDVVFITSASFGLTESQYGEQSLAGGVFAFRPGIKGRGYPHTRRGPFRDATEVTPRAQKKSSPGIEYRLREEKNVISDVSVFGVAPGQFSAFPGRTSNRREPRPARKHTP